MADTDEAENNQLSKHQRRAAVKAKMLVERQTPRGLLTTAGEFHEAARLIVDNLEVDRLGQLKSNRYHNPLYYLCGHLVGPH